ncbi:hypothetical protein GVN16_05840 [Emticicia sp. CRIBPO]|uniref:hypothetical protein n=1 Tax=Emticicia sp. CRIBPO TaxID=2683258 RepID=UPI0014123D74|nr:hypothetical protein [Emticicia sp. CRIBPO]NBA85272.1 hypothetical protein [Emticicia sp. CRIBPO]
MSKTLVNASLSEADKNEILTKLGEITAKLPFLVELTRSERQKVRKIGHKEGYVGDCLRIAKSFPNILPPTVEVAKLERDFQLMNTINDIMVIVKGLADRLEDTRMMAGSNAMVESDSIYGYLKQGVRKDAGLKVQMEQMALHHKKERKKVSE